MFVGWGYGFKLLWLVQNTGLLWLWGLDKLCVFLFVVVFGFVFVGLSLGAGGHGLKLLWCAKPLVYCGFGASKGDDTLCGIVFG